MFWHIHIIQPWWKWEKKKKTAEQFKGKQHVLDTKTEEQEPLSWLFKKKKSNQILLWSEVHTREKSLEFSS